VNVTTVAAAPGDVLAVLKTGAKTPGKLSWLGNAVLIFELLQGKPDISDHVVILTHQDAHGRWMGIEGRPGGVGIVDATVYLGYGRTRSNHMQSRRDDGGQSTLFLASCAVSLGISYDWIGIAEDALNTVHAYDLSNEIDHLWRWPSDDGKLPGHVVCSSLAARLYQQVGWAHPDTGTERLCEPADWWVWSDKEMWNGCL